MNRLMRPKNRKANCKGFTLVELIVVLVILAILAAILIPALLGWIDRAREKQDLLNAKNALTAVQAGLVEEYAVKAGSLKPGDTIIDCKKNTTPLNDNKDVNATETAFATKVLETIDKKDTKTTNGKNDPMLIMFAVGSNVAGSTVTEHDKFTVYYMLYQETIDSTPMIYFNGTWSKTHPRANDSSKLIDKNNIVQEGPLKGKKLQYYVISNKLADNKDALNKMGIEGSAKDFAAGKSGFWNYVKSLK